MGVDVSVIVPIYKGQKYMIPLMKMIKNCSENLDNYTTEIIFVNDYPDKALYLTEISKMQGIKYTIIENQENMGIHKTKVIGVHYAEGEYIIFLDQDDLLDARYLRSQLDCIKVSDAVICNGLHRNGEKIFSESKPMKNHYYFDEYLKSGYPLISLGQLLIKKNAIPKEWLINPLLHNGWDDHFLWAIMMAQNIKVKINNEILYVHTEDGNNASFNWAQMSLSAQDFKTNFLKLKRMDNKQRSRFINCVNERIERYVSYQELSELIKEIDRDEIVSYLKNKGLCRIAIYGMGVFGEKTLEILQETDIYVLYGIDQRHDIKKENIPVVGLECELEKVEGIIVSTFFCFDEVKKKLKKKCSFDIEVISLLEMLKKVNGGM